jgi:tRNA 2-thiouridine synthesizing protein C
MKKNILVILSSAPYGNSKARDAIDFILTSAAYEQNISVLFQGDGVFQIKQHQDPTALGLKNTSSLIQAFEMYDIEDVYADKNSLLSRSLSETDILPNIMFIPKEQSQTLINNADVVLTF